MPNWRATASMPYVPPPGTTMAAAQQYASYAGVARFAWSAARTVSRVRGEWADEYRQGGRLCLERGADVLHHALELRRHVVERTVRVHNREFKLALGVRRASRWAVRRCAACHGVRQTVPLSGCAQVLRDGSEALHDWCV